MIQRYTLSAACLILVVAMAVAMKEPAPGGSSLQDHPTTLKFSHTLHVKDQGVACADCHTMAKASTKSADHLLPNHESCQSCHEEQLSSDCAYCHTNPDNIVAAPHPDRELIFSHEAHAGTQNISCETCHAGLDDATKAATGNYPAMATCTTCHSGKAASTNCESCHTNFTSLVPPDHISTNFRKEHSKLTRVGALDVECASCHTESFCQDCHTGTEVRGFFGSGDLMSDPSARSFTKDSPKQLRLQQAHSLNYRFTHGIDAKSKDVECSSCHETQSFCVECHEAGGNITQPSFKPSTHRKAGFATIGKGSGGGLHAELARRDLESCIACHDVEGSDPVCLTCHTETGSVR
jgi:hypothetical protein